MFCRLVFLSLPDNALVSLGMLGFDSLSGLIFKPSTQESRKTSCGYIYANLMARVKAAFSAPALATAVA